jgi:hypothetical protein
MNVANAPIAIPAQNANPNPAPAPGQAPGGKKKNPSNPKKPQVTTSSATQRLFAAEIKVTGQENHTEYLLDMQSILNLAINYDATVREQHRRGGHPVNFVYQGMFFKSLAAKLQAVGVETFQIRVNDDCKIGIEGVQLPQVLTHVIAQFGIAYDGTGTKLYPKVTNELIVYINHLANCCITSNQPALMNVVNHNNFYEAVYGGTVQAFLGLLELRETLGIGAIAFNTHDIAGVDQLGRGIFTEFCLANGAYPTQAELQATANGTIGSWFLMANAVPVVGANAIALAGLVGAAAIIRGGLVNVANPFAAVALPVQLNAANAQLVNPGVIRQTTRYLQTIYNCSAPVINGTGSLAPLISVDITARRVTASSFLFNCPVRDYVIAMSMLGTTNIIVKESGGCIFNVATQANMVRGYEASKMKISFNEALIAVFDDCLK